MTPDELRALCRQLGWTQATAAERLDINLRTYRYYEAGTTSAGRSFEHVPQTVAIAMRAYRFAASVEGAADGREIEHLARDFAEELSRTAGAKTTS